jgi:hypothetical protein
MKKLLQILTGAIIFAFLFSVYGYGIPVNIQKDGGALTQSFTVPSGISISATGTGTIAATTVTGFAPASGKVLTLSNTLTFTGTDSSSVNFGAGGTVLYSGGSYVASIAGTANQISASAATGAVTLSLAGPHAFTTLTSTALLLGAGTSPISASDLTYSTPTLTVPASFGITGAGSLTFTAGGTNKDITFTPADAGAQGAVTSKTFGSSSSVFGFTGGFQVYKEAVSGAIFPAYEIVSYANGQTAQSFLAIGGAGGTQASPTTMAASSTIGGVNWYDRANSLWKNGGSIGVQTSSTFSNSDFSTQMFLGPSSSTGQVSMIRLAGGGASSLGRAMAFGGASIGTAQFLFDIGGNASFGSSWGVSGALISVTARTLTDTVSTGTVASAVANGFGVPTFSASSATTFTNTANVYIAGDVAAGTNVTLTNSYGLWNVGKTRLDGDVIIAPGGSVTENIIIGSTTDTGLGRIQLPASTTSGGGIGFTTEFSMYRSAANQVTIGAQSGSFRAIYGGTGANNVDLWVGNGGALGGFRAKTDFNYAFFDNVNTFEMLTIGGGGAAGSGAAGRLSVNYTQDATISAAGSIVSLGGIYATKKIISGTSVFDGTTASLAITGGAGNMTITAGTGNSRTLALQTTTSGGVATTALSINATQDTTLAGKITTLGGATFHTTSSALTDGAGASVATFTNAPAAGNPTKWIGINDNGTTRYIPAF